jgi:phage terminase large subunit-like protein
VTHDQLLECAASPAAFRRSLRLDTGAPFVADNWQEADFRAMDFGWLRVVGKPAVGGFSRAWIERPKSASKTADVAVAVAWALLFSAKRIEGIVAAGDADQAAMIRRALERLVESNPWMDPLVIGKWEVTNKRTGSSVTIITSDVSTSHGWLVDFVVADELTHWSNRDLFDSLLATAGKKPTTLFMTIMNAGSTQTWQATVRESVRTDPAWYFSSLTTQPSWMSAERLAEQKRLLPPPVFSRLWLNQWSSGAGDALAECDIAAAVVHDAPMTGDEDGYIYFGGLDLGVSRDHSALSVVGIRENRIRLADVRSWAPPPGGKIDLARVRVAILDANRRFRLSRLLYDPHQAELLAQDVAKAGILVEGVPFTTASLTEMASCLLERFHSRTIELYDDSGLLADLRALRLIDRGTSYRLDAPRNSAGHGDRATACILGILGAERHGKYVEDDGDIELIVGDGFEVPFMRQAGGWL